LAIRLKALIELPFSHHHTSYRKQVKYMGEESADQNQKYCGKKSPRHLSAASDTNTAYLRIFSILAALLGYASLTQRYNF